MRTFFYDSIFILAIALATQSFAADAKFSEIISGNGKPTSDFSELKSFGCVGNGSFIYFDLNKSDVKKSLYTATWGFTGKIAKPNDREALPAKIYLKSTLEKENPVAIGFYLKEKEDSGYAAEFSGDLTLEGNSQAKLVLKSYNHWHLVAPAGNYQCELFSSPHILLSENQALHYECGDFSFHFNRPYKGSNLVQFYSESYYFGNPSACDSYYYTYRPVMDEPSDSKGRSLSTLTGGSPSSGTRVRYHKQGGSQPNNDYYFRLFDFGATSFEKPPEEFDVRRTEQANWYSEPPCKGSSRHTQVHHCKRVR